MDKPILVGITGNIASGKSSVGQILEEQGYKVIDSDFIVHEIYEHDEAAQNLILKEFGTLDKKEIARQVFSNDDASAKRKILEAILHPRVDAYLRNWVEQNATEDILFNLVPLLFEAKLEARYDHIVLITTTEEQQVARLRSRNPDWNEGQAIARIRSQMSQELKAQGADYVIENNAGLDELKPQVLKIISEILKP